MSHPLCGKRHSHRLCGKRSGPYPRYTNLFYVDGNGSQGSMYGVIMNSVENAQNIGRILGCLYPNYVNQVNFTAYYYDRFYHIALPNPGNATLQSVMRNSLMGVWNYNAQGTDWSNANVAPYSRVNVQTRINSGIAWLKLKQSYVPPALWPTPNI